jgi:hypothetical protein
MIEPGVDRVMNIFQETTAFRSKVPRIIKGIFVQRAYASYDHTVDLEEASLLNTCLQQGFRNQNPVNIITISIRIIYYYICRYIGV